MKTSIREDIEENIKASQETYSELSSEVKDKLSWFQDQKLGVIFHFGLYSEAGIVESWQLSAEDEWARKKGAWRPTMDVLRKDYWALNKVFNPTKFDPMGWAELCQKAGFKYMIFTTKHHDGFNMYDTKETDYKVTAEPCPFSRTAKPDIFGEVVQAFREKGLGIGAYYSKADWHSPYYWAAETEAKGRYVSYNPDMQPRLWEQFKKFTKKQLLEITENYGKMDILWLDAGWVSKEFSEDIDMDDIVCSIRKTTPDILVVDRAVGGLHENYVTPERKIPEELPQKVWESNIPLAKNWGYVPNDIYKPFSEILETMLRIVALGGNVIFGVGPKPDGRLPEEAVKILKQLGEWLEKFGKAIYATRPLAVPEKTKWLVTHNESSKTIYAILLDADKKAADTLPLHFLTANYAIEKVTYINTNTTYDNKELTVLVEAVIGEKAPVSIISFSYR